MVVSLTIIPVLAARFLGTAARCPPAARSTICWPAATRGCCSVGLRFPRTAVLLALLAVVPGWWLFQHVETGFMPDMDEGAFVLDYEMPVGTSLAETDRVMRRVEAILQRTPDVDGYIRRTGAELGFFATEPFTGDILVSLKPPGQRRPMDEIFDVAPRGHWKAKCPELATEFVPLVQDQINDLAGVDRPIEVKLFGPDVARLRELAERGGQRWSRRAGNDGRQPQRRILGNPDIVDPSRQRSDRSGSGSRNWTSKTSSARPSTARWPARFPKKTG